MLNNKIFLEIGVNPKENRKNKLIFSEEIRNIFSSLNQEQDVIDHFGSKSQVIIYGTYNFSNEYKGLVIIMPKFSYIESANNYNISQVKRTRANYKFVLDTKLCSKILYSTRYLKDSSKLYGVELDKLNNGYKNKSFKKNIDFVGFYFPFDQNIFIDDKNENKPTIKQRELIDAYNDIYESFGSIVMRKGN